MHKLAMILCVMGASLAAQWPNRPNPGVPRTPDGKPDLKAPPPRTPDGKPDLSGLWRKVGFRYDDDIAADLGIPADPLDATEAFLKSAPRGVDLIRARFRYGRTAHYIGAGGMGLDAEAAHLANTKFKAWPGVTRYLAGTLWAFFHDRAMAVHAEIDGIPWDGRVLFIAVANSTRYGSGIRIAPEAEMDDGRLDVALVGEIGWARLLEAIPVVLTSGNLRGFPEVRRVRCKRIALRAERPTKVHGDGELLGESPVEFEVLPGAVRVMTPKRRARTAT